MAVIFSDDFLNDGTDDNLDAWPNAGDPDYDMENGASGDLVVDGTNDRVEEQNANLDLVWSVINASVPSTDQQMQLDGRNDNAGETAGAGVRVQNAAISLYFTYIDQATANELQLFRANAGSFTEIDDDNAGTADGETHEHRLRSTGTNPVVLTGWLDGTQRLTFSDSTGDRWQTGAPGGYCYGNTAAADVFFDNVEVDDLIAAGGQLLSIGSNLTGGHNKHLGGMLT